MIIREDTGWMFYVLKIWKHLPRYLSYGGYLGITAKFNFNYIPGQVMREREDEIVRYRWGISMVRERGYIKYKI